MVLNESTLSVLGVIPGGGVRKISVSNTGSAALTALVIEGQATPFTPWVPIAGPAITYSSPTTLMGVALPVGTSDITKLGGGTAGDVYVDASHFYNVRVSAAGLAGADASVSYVTPLGTSTSSSSASGGTYYDVVIYGATFGGCMAAFAAARNGASVAIFEPRDDVGGMVVGGVAFTDANTPTVKVRSTITGMTNEFYRNLSRAYLIDQQTYFQSFSYSVEPKRAQLELDRLLRKWNIPVYQNAKLTSASKTGTIINSVTFDTVGDVKGKVFIDSTYVGDLMAMVLPQGTGWTIGREAASTYSEAALSAGTQVQAGDQPTVAIDPYITPGVPASGLIWGVQDAVPPATGSADSKVMAMGYRLMVTTGANKIAFPTTPPANYDASRYELLGRHAAANGQGWTTMQNMFLFQQAISSLDYPGVKFDINNKGLMSLDYVHPESSEYPLATWARRAEIESNIKDYTLGLLYFCQTDTRIPAAARANVATYGFCGDEYQGNGGLPRHPYCREARRMIGGTVVKGTDITAINAVTVPLGQAYYTMDSHPSQYMLDAGRTKVVLEGTMSGVAAAGGARISRAIIEPQQAHCTNLLVTWCGSMSRAAFTSVRMEPINGCLGEGAGTIAALAVKRGVAVQLVPGFEVNRLLNLYGWMDQGALSISADGTSYTDGTCVATGTWSTSATTLFGTTSILSCALTNGAGLNYVTFTPSTTKLLNLSYDVYIKWSDSLPTTRASPTITVTANGVATAVTVNQNNVGDGGDWYYLGRFPMRKGDAPNNKVVITHDNSANGTNVAGVKFVPAPM